MDAAVQIPFDEPVRFLAVSWDAGRKFGWHGVLLEPVVRYDPGNNELEALIENTILEIADRLEAGEPLGHEDITSEFSGRGWTLRGIRRFAASERSGAHTEERWMVFLRTENGKVNFQYVNPPR